MSAAEFGKFRWRDHLWLWWHQRPGHETTAWGVDVNSGKKPYWTCTCGSKAVPVFTPYRSPR